jgi:hypothetical protein
LGSRGSANTTMSPRSGGLSSRRPLIGITPIGAEYGP